MNTRQQLGLKSILTNCLALYQSNIFNFAVLGIIGSGIYILKDVFALPFNWFIEVLAFLLLTLLIIPLVLLSEKVLNGEEEELIGQRKYTC